MWSALVVYSVCGSVNSVCVCVTIPCPLSLSPGVFPDWAIAVIVVGVLALVAVVFCLIGLCFACHTGSSKDCKSVSLWEVWGRGEQISRQDGGRIRGRGGGQRREEWETNRERGWE